MRRVYNVMWGGGQFEKHVKIKREGDGGVRRSWSWMWGASDNRRKIRIWSLDNVRSIIQFNEDQLMWGRSDNVRKRGNELENMMFVREKWGEERDVVWGVADNVRTPQEENVFLRRGLYSEEKVVLWGEKIMWEDNGKMIKGEDKSMI